MIKSKHRRTYLVERITSSLRGAGEKQPGNEVSAHAGVSTGAGASRPAQVALAFGLLIGFLAIPLGILFLLLN